MNAKSHKADIIPSLAASGNGSKLPRFITLTLRLIKIFGVTCKEPLEYGYHYKTLCDELSMKKSKTVGLNWDLNPGPLTYCIDPKQEFCH